MGMDLCALSIIIIVSLFQCCRSETWNVTGFGETVCVSGERCLWR